MYKKTTEDIQDLLQLMNCNGFPFMYCTYMVDSNRDYINYKELKKLILIDPGPLFIHSLHTLGNFKDDILEELQWFRSNEIELVIMKLPSTWIFNEKEKNLQNISVLIDVFNILQTYPGFEFQNPDFIDGGRKKIRFPENWEYLFEKYSAREISANDFQKLTGLKRATFYNLLCEYKELIRLNKLEQKKLVLDEYLNRIQ